ncbi:MAG TPA: hypothetical protein VNO75_05110 [Gemmatimonadaceae bacterium]|nr:hypothetical protein [Gemmatimonadaceae bacterium]
MPIVRMEDLPNSARVWVFGADHALGPKESAVLLEEVDRFLAQWKAHGTPLTAAKAWTHDLFLTIAVDQAAAGASGCSIDGLFRALKALEPRIGASLLTSGCVFFREPSGSITCAEREKFTALGAEGKVTAETQVFDPTVTSLGEWRARFELKAGESWHHGLLHGQPA